MPESPTVPSHPHNTEFETALVALETHLDRLLARDGTVLEARANELPPTLARAVAGFGAAARHGEVPPMLRRRLARASGIVAAQRESLARATAALDRAIEVLLPSAMPPVCRAPRVRRGNRGSNEALPAASAARSPAPLEWPPAGTPPHR